MGIHQCGSVSSLPYVNDEHVRAAASQIVQCCCRRTFLALSSCANSESNASNISCDTCAGDAFGGCDWSLVASRATFLHARVSFQNIVLNSSTDCTGVWHSR